MTVKTILVTDASASRFNNELNKAVGRCIDEGFSVEIKFEPTRSGNYGVLFNALVVAQKPEST